MHFFVVLWVAILILFLRCFEIIATVWYVFFFILYRSPSDILIISIVLILSDISIITIVLVVRFPPPVKLTATI